MHATCMANPLATKPCDTLQYRPQYVLWHLSIHANHASHHPYSLCGFCEVDRQTAAAKVTLVQYIHGRFGVGFLQGGECIDLRTLVMHCNSIWAGMRPHSEKCRQVVHARVERDVGDADSSRAVFIHWFIHLPICLHSLLFRRCHFDDIVARTAGAGLVFLPSPRRPCC